MRFFSTLIVCLTTFLTLWGFIPTAEECEIYDSTLRLHVIANSDSESDQAIKLKVRDEILEHISGYDAKSKQEALATVMADTEMLVQIATDVIRENGKADNVKIEIGEEEYPLRNYEDFSLPAGTYTSVRVIIGEGKGQNWWCVLFPNLCLPSSGSEAWLVEHDLQILQTSPQLEPRFALMEWLQNMKNS